MRMVTDYIKFEACIYIKRNRKEFSDDIFSEENKKLRHYQIYQYSYLIVGAYYYERLQAEDRRRKWEYLLKKEFDYLSKDVLMILYKRTILNSFHRSMRVMRYEAEKHPAGNCDKSILNAPDGI